jgi:hypothetical protein
MEVTDGAIMRVLNIDRDKGIAYMEDGTMRRWVEELDWSTPGRVACEPTGFVYLDAMIARTDA